MRACVPCRRQPPALRAALLTWCISTRRLMPLLPLAPSILCVPCAFNCVSGAFVRARWSECMPAVQASRRMQAAGAVRAPVGAAPTLLRRAPQCLHGRCAQVASTPTSQAPTRVRARNHRHAHTLLSRIAVRCHCLQSLAYLPRPPYAPASMMGVRQQLSSSHVFTCCVAVAALASRVLQTRVAVAALACTCLHCAAPAALGCTLPHAAAPDAGRPVGVAAYRVARCVGRSAACAGTRAGRRVQKGVLREQA